MSVGWGGASGTAAGIAAAVVPYFVVSYFRTARVHKFEEQLPEAVELIARAMRAGHAFTTGIKIAADELPAPAGPDACAPESSAGAAPVTAL